MARVKLSDKVNANWWGITTPAQLLDEGKAIVEKVERFGKREVTKYFCTLVNLDGTLSNNCWDIGQKAYESRAAKGQNKLPAKEETKTDEYSVSFDPSSFVLTVGDHSFASEWDKESQSYTFTIHGNSYEDSDRIFAAMRAHFPVFEAEGRIEDDLIVVNFFPEVETKQVTIPACVQHEGIYLLTAKVAWVCPECGKARGEVHDTFSYDGSRRISCHGWANPCGHIDKYSAVRKEASENGLNP
jgi:hypothetical protein